MQVGTLEHKMNLLKDALQKTSKGENTGMWSFLWSGFQADEALLVQLMNTAPPINGPYPTPSTPGNIEYSWALYFLNVILPASGSIGKWLQEKLSTDFDMPPTTITSANWSTWGEIWSSTGILLGDGSLVSTQRYAVMDIGWSLAVLDFIRLQIGLESMAPFNSNPNSLTINTNTQPSLTIALMGDWGTGNYQDGPSPNSPSAQVMTAIKNLAPDMVIHLGDVYYAGTENGIFPGDNEEQNNLVDAWKYNAPLGNFTLNSNHEMYSGANGYFNVALASDIFAPYHTGPKSNLPTSYFSVEYGDYVIIGLDSAYNATGMFMQGRITDAYQPAFMKQVASGKKVIILTHHNPIDTLGDAKNSLWDDVTSANALNGAPAMWYWGHIHNGIVYSDLAVTGNTTLARCLGNASIPIGTGNWLNNENISFFTNTPLNDGTPNNSLRVKNGFAVLTIANNTITETWYDQSGNQCWPLSAKA